LTRIKLENIRTIRVIRGLNRKGTAMQQSGSGWVVYGDDVEAVAFDWGVAKFLSEPAVTSAERFSFGMVVLAPGKGHERHNHPGAEEIIYVLSGEGQQMVDDQPPITVRAGASIYVPADVYHSTLNTSWEPMRLLVVYSPAGPERLLRDIPGSRVIPAGQIPA
jgi:oxalate decarboxylase/phosphoglucose isomerase-like protein (cupin superfamily)